MGSFDDFSRDCDGPWEREPATDLLSCKDETTGLRRFMLHDRRYDEVVPGLFVGPEHWDYAGLRYMVEAILDLRHMNPEEGGPAAWAAKAGLEYANFGFDDGCLPPDALLRNALEWLREHHGRGISCLVHCAAGVSRSPFVLSLYLLPRFGWDVGKTLGHLASRRREVLPARIYLDYLHRWASQERRG